MTYTKNTLVCLLLIALIFLTYTCIAAVNEYRSWQRQVATDSHTIALNINQRVSDISQNASGVLIQAGLTLDTINTAAMAQREHWNRTSQETAQLVADARLVLKTTDESLNGETVCKLNERENGPLMLCERKGGVLPEIATAVRDINTTQRQVGQETVLVAWEAREQMQKLGGVLDNAALTLAGTAKVTNDPNVPKTIANLEGISSNVEKATRPGKLYLKAIMWMWEQTTKIFTAW